jgi:hypothetical protein
MSRREERRPGEYTGAAKSHQGDDGSRQRSGRRRRSPARRPLVDPGPPAAFPWLSTDDVRRARQAFARLVVLDESTAAEDFDDHAARFAQRWGSEELATALRYAHRLAPLPGPAARLLRDLTALEAG